MTDGNACISVAATDVVATGSDLLQPTPAATIDRPSKLPQIKHERIFPLRLIHPTTKQSVVQSSCSTNGCAAEKELLNRAALIGRLVWSSVRRRTAR